MGRPGTGPANSVLQAPELRVTRKRACAYGRGKKSPLPSPGLEPPPGRGHVRCPPIATGFCAPQQKTLMCYKPPWAAATD